MQETGAIKLPSPETEGGMPLMQALKARHSTQAFGSQPLSLQVLSNLLWAASGVNRSDTGQRTAPSAHDWREIDVVVTSAEGAYRYGPSTHTLTRVAAGDLRHLTGVQDFVALAPVNLVYVANLDRMNEAGAEDKAFYSATDTGFIAQNVYLVLRIGRFGCGSARPGGSRSTGRGPRAGSPSARHPRAIRGLSGWQCRIIQHARYRYPIRNDFDHLHDLASRFPRNGWISAICLRLSGARWCNGWSMLRQ